MEVWSTYCGKSIGAPNVSQSLIDHFTAICLNVSDFRAPALTLVKTLPVLNATVMKYFYFIDQGIHLAHQYENASSPKEQQAIQQKFHAVRNATAEILKYVATISQYLTAVQMLYIAEDISLHCGAAAIDCEVTTQQLEKWVNESIVVQKHINECEKNCDELRMLLKQIKDQINQIVPTVRFCRSLSASLNETNVLASSLSAQCDAAANSDGIFMSAIKSSGVNLADDITQPTLIVIFWNSAKEVLQLNMKYYDNLVKLVSAIISH